MYDESFEKLDENIVSKASVILPSGSIFYDNKIKWNLYELRLEPTDGNKKIIFEGDKTKDNLEIALRSSRIGEPFVKIINLSEKTGDRAVFAHAPAELYLPVPAGAKHFIFGYGILPLKLYPDRGGDGVDFVIQAIFSDGTSSIIFNKNINPFKSLSTNSSKIKSDKIKIPENCIKLKLLTLPGINNNTNYDQSYWTDLKFTK
jgi:hypothetical protein